MNRWGSIFVLTWAIIFSACNNNKVDRLPSVEFSSTGIHDISESFLLEDMIRLESTTEAIVGELTNLIFSDEYIYISDISPYGSNLYIFDHSGKLIKKLIPGNGPGEFQFFSDFLFNQWSEQIYVLEMLLSRVSVYSKTGDFIDHFKLPVEAYKFHLLSPTRMIAYTDFLGSDVSGYEDKSLFTLDLEDQEWRVKNGQIAYPVKLRGLVMDAILSSPFTVSPEGLYFVDKFSYTLYKYDPARVAFSPQLRLDFADKNLPEGFFKKVDLHDAEQELLRGYIHDIGNAYISKDQFHFQANSMKDTVARVGKDHASNTTYFSSNVIDSENELILDIFSNHKGQDKLLALVNPEILGSYKFMDPSSAGFLLNRDLNTSDNYVLAIYSEK